MSMSNIYTYISEDNLENTQNYMYTPYGGKAFLDAYLESRTPYLTENAEEAVSVSMQTIAGRPKASQDKTLEELLFLWNSDNWKDASCRSGIDQYIKRFEVRKQLYGAYDSEIRKPIFESGYRESDRYLTLAAIAEKAYRVFHSLKYLNCLLKLNDTLLSLISEMDDVQTSLVKGLVTRESGHIQTIAHRKRISLYAGQRSEYSRILSDVACVFADTTRSQAYIQAMVRNGVKPAKCFILAASPDEMRKADEQFKSEGRQYFNIDEPLLETIEKNQIEYAFLGTRDINDPAVVDVISMIPQQYLIYSGYGGYILQPHLFQLGKRWIHVHAGILPAYRGSTTAYYSLLNNGRIGATAIFLNEQIDEGDIIAEREFLPPADGTLIDYIYEPYIRSCVLVDALRMYRESGEFFTKSQNSGDKVAETYFIIHPVLKHIAILGLNRSEHIQDE